MAKTIEDALGLYALGKSLRECEKQTNIPKSSIDYEAKKRGIIKGSLGQLTEDKIRVEAEIRTLDPVLSNIVNNEVNKRLEGMAFYSSKARETVEVGFQSFLECPTPLGMKVMLEGYKAGMQVEGVVPFYPQPSTTNINASSNAQAAVIRQPTQIIFEGGDGIND